MKHAIQLVSDCVAAGYGKIHLDASMRCADDDPELPLPIEVSAARTAQLCQASERAASDLDLQPFYIIGSEVPTPGGEGGSAKAQVTHTDNVAETIRITQKAFANLGLEAAWERVVGVVVQPGVEFYDQDVLAYDPDQAADLSRFILKFPALVYEAHSTDYQTGKALGQMVQGHFAILKVGPELTHAFREMIFALEGIEGEMACFESRIQPSRVSEIIDQVMLEKPEYWSGYYSGSSAEQAFARKFSYLDRVRYYWDQPRIKQAVDQLLANLVPGRIPPGLVSQYLPRQYQRICEGSLSHDPADWIDDQLALILDKYYRATTPGGTENQAAK
jgi:D-tagatose-1,6-bisphosphate aldolase subunit GatZ/KbaZ